MKYSPAVLILFLTSTFGLVTGISAAQLKSIDDFKAAAAKANAVLTVPDWEQTPEAVEASVKTRSPRRTRRWTRSGART